MPDDTEKPARDAQEQHWEGMLATRAELFGRGASDAGRRSAAEFHTAGSRRILELGGGQGRDSLFFAASGFDVHVLDYARAGIDTLLRKAAQAGLTSRISAAQHDVRRPLPVASVSVEELEEGTLPRRLYRVTVRRPIAPAESACEPS